MTARKATFNALRRVAAGAYSTIALDGVLSSAQLLERDNALATGIFYGVQENSLLLDYIIDSMCKGKVENDVRIILRMGLYQLGFMDKIPDNAAVDESVRLAKQVGLQRASGFVNGVLRSYIRAGKKPKLPDQNKQPLLYLSIKYSCPVWLAELWLQSYGKQTTEDILKMLSGRPPIFARVNTQKTNAQELVSLLEQEGVQACAVECAGLPQGTVITLENTGDVEKLTSYSKGFFHIQDISSQICCNILSPQVGDTIADICAAPGGKSFTMAQLAQDKCEIYSCDIHPQRVNLIQTGAQRLGLASVKTVVRDALSDNQELIKPADRVLCDVPCSGLGIIRRKPDIKNKKPQEFEKLPELQYAILENSAKLLKKGGRLVYSTCTLNPAENSAVVDKFLTEHDDFRPLDIHKEQWSSCINGKEGAGAVNLSVLPDQPPYMVTILPQTNGSDGFFVAALERKE